nr:MAG TPA: hypothetical protein [Caudoviricetes sp.]
MKEFLILILFTFLPPLVVASGYCFIVWEFTWDPFIRSLMFIFGIAGFFLGLNFISNYKDL